MAKCGTDCNSPRLSDINETSPQERKIRNPKGYNERENLPYRFEAQGDDGKPVTEETKTHRAKVDKTVFGLVDDGTPIIKIKSDDETIRVFSRYMYSRRHVQETSEYCHDLYNDIGWKTGSKPPVGEQVVIYSLFRENHDIITIGELEQNKIQYDEMASGVKAHLHDLSIILAPLEKRESVFELKLPVKMILFYLRGQGKVRIAECQDKIEKLDRTEIVGVACDDELEKGIDCLLERYMYRKLKEDLGRLEDLLVEPRKKRELNQDTRDTEEMIEQIEINNAKINDLKMDILSMFATSGIPEKETPNEKVNFLTLSEKLSHELTSLSSVVGVGYRYDTLQVNFDEETCEEERDKDKKRVQAILAENDVKKYLFRYICKRIKPFATCESGSKIGSICSVGTLGGFVKHRENTASSLTGMFVTGTSDDPEESEASDIESDTLTENKSIDEDKDLDESEDDTPTQESQQQCAPLSKTFVSPCVSIDEKDKRYIVLSKHVSKTIRNGRLYFYSEDGEREWIATLHNGSDDNTPCMDIELANIVEDWVPRCKPIYKTEEGRQCPNIVLEERNSDWPYKKVYIHGAESKPGKGKITTENYRMGQMEPHIIVENRARGNVPFSKRGDSGAVVLAEDPCGHGNVYALAMVVGEMQADGKGTGEYLVLPLKRGLQYLSWKYNGSYTLVTTEQDW